MKFTKKTCLMAGAALICCGLICGCGGSKDPVPPIAVTVPEVTEQPSAYTWQEYLAMTAEQQLEFQRKFGSQEVFEAWMENAMKEDVLAECPWEEPGAKQPEAYTWAEFEALSGGEQIAFQNALGKEAFAAWMDESQNRSGASPWEEPGAKQPEEYTWAEFEALSGAEQIAFQNAMGQEAFAAWMQAAQNRSAAYPWEEPGAKQPEEYTWAEFEALSGEHQIAFQRVLGVEAFEAWMNRVNP